MTNPKWLIAIATLFVGMSLICGVIEGNYLGGASMFRLQVLMSLPFPLGETLPIPWVRNLWGLLWFDYAYFQGGWAIFKYALFWPISLGLVASYGLVLVEAAISAIGRTISGLTSIFRR